MRKPVLLLWLAFCMIALAACASKAESTAVKLAKAAPPESSAERIQYTNEKLGFSFAIPDSWESENYKAVIIEKKLKDGSKTTTVSFQFQGDAENPLLSISLVPKKGWDKKSTKHPSGDPVYLGTKGDIVYICTLPKDCPYDVGTKADLYNSMILPTEEVKKRFQILDANTK
ncbi:hypothetical protein [Caproiciproducens galactitolivorans]|uniref:Lipoprotein n=1 Tax=Caproiciproducens galactitolivorans TaxID=642589 RepID=A0ABT4BR54_9FIRM|nr:hypothetical protein [Caproiciproducens galactitolivorans]MCY1712825.1 hypothetical protein [Caproiciproducens galactitolivorans]